MALKTLVAIMGLRFLVILMPFWFLHPHAPYDPYPCKTLNSQFGAVVILLPLISLSWPWWPLWSLWPLLCLMTLMPLMIPMTLTTLMTLVTIMALESLGIRMPVWSWCPLWPLIVILSTLVFLILLPSSLWKSQYSVWSSHDLFWSSWPPWPSQSLWSLWPLWFWLVWMQIKIDRGRSQTW